MKKFHTCLVWVSLVCVSSMSLAFSEYTETLRRSEWPEYVNGPNILSLPPVYRILQKFEEHEKITVEIRFPGGEMGRMWAESLASWLITFGMPKKYIEFSPGSGAADRLVISLIDRR